MMRLYADRYISKVGGLASPGIDDCAGYGRKPDRGLVHTGIEVLNQDGEPVLTMTAVNFLLRRAAAG